MGIVDPELHRASQFDCTTWAREVLDFLSAKLTNHQRSLELKS
jgi:hypothetical protein